MKTLEQDEIVRLITIYVENEATQDEVETIENWINASAENKLYYLQLKNVWEASIQSIHPTQIVTQNAAKKVLKKISKESRNNNFWYYWQRIAAILIITFLVGVLVKLLLPLNKDINQGVVYNEVYASFGTRSALKLADGSLVWLNSGSSIKYPDKFDRNERIIYLKGEAYFEVQSDVKWPFIVKTANMSVKATGTKFCVSAFSNEHSTEVTLLHGKVMVSMHKAEGEEHLISVMLPNQHLVYDSVSGKVNIKNEDGYKYIAWKDGKLIFRNEPFSQVIRKISELYKVDIELKGNGLSDYRYRATFEDESLSEILKLLKLSSPIDYKEINRQHLPDGSFSKRKIIIFKRHE